MSKSFIAKDQLRSFIDRIERLNEEREALSADIREVFSEAKGTGFDTKVMRQVIALRKLDKADFQEAEAMRDLYLSALGMLGDTPLGQAAISKVSAPKRDEIPHDRETGEIVERAAKSPAVRKAAEKLKTALGTPVEPTPEEKAKGVIAAFEGKDGTRCSIAFPKSEPMPDIPASLDRRERAPPQPSA